MPATVRGLQARYASGTSYPSEVVAAALGRANSNAGRNVYLARDAAGAMGEARALRPGDRAQQPLWGVPVSLKDCFDLRGFVTTAGARVLAETRQPAAEDSAVAARLRGAGAVIVGKTHLHPLAYGITGENPDYGDCAQPGRPDLLTGGSSSGAAASVMEGSAWAAIGTDTGGSIRVPAALCGLAGYRASVTLADASLWRGGDHLAESFDTLGWLYRDLRDGPVLARALFGLAEVEASPLRGLRVGVPNADFFHDGEPAVLATLDRWMDALRERDAVIERFDAGMWAEALEIFAPIQASEAAPLHPEPRDRFEPGIAQRLRWGALLPEPELAVLRARLLAFRAASTAALASFDVLLLPACPVAELRVGEDQSGARARILRYTTPISLLGWPAMTLPPLVPGERGGPQMVGKLGSDAALLALSAQLASVADARLLP